jgi:hypothetical protein
MTSLASENELQLMENDVLTIADFGRVLQGITDGQEISREYVPGIYRMVVEIIECANSLQQRRDIRDADWQIT